jgi:hypothetical protein
MCVVILLFLYQITNVITEYQGKLSEMPFVPKTSYKRFSLGYCGDANKAFLTFLFSDNAIGVHFLKAFGVLRSKMQFKTPAVVI